MSQCKEKTTCIFFRSLFDAAEKIHETNPETAYQIYRSYFRYAFCETEDIETDDMIAELLVRQNVESFNAADERHANAVKNGEKGKDYGSLGGEYGKLGGRPRKGETREEYWERKRKESEEIPPKTPLIRGDMETPLTIATAITSTESNTKTITEDISYSIDNTITKEKDSSYEDFSNNLKEICMSFVKKHHDYNYLLDEETFLDYYYDNVFNFQRYVNEKLKSDISIKDCVILILGYAQEFQEML